MLESSKVVAQPYSNILVPFLQSTAIQIDTCVANQLQLLKARDTPPSCQIVYKFYSIVDQPCIHGESVVKRQRRIVSSE
jgi:hypothetical protein